jgi:hypothetical protein
VSDYDKGREDGRREVLDLIRERWRWSQATLMETAADAIERELGYESCAVSPSTSTR